MTTKLAYTGGAANKSYQSPVAANTLTEIFPASGVGMSVTWEGRGQYAAQLIAGAGWAKLGNFLVTNHNYAPLLLRARNCSRFGVQFDGGIYGVTGDTSVNADGQLIIPRLGNFASQVADTAAALVSTMITPEVVTPVLGAGTMFYSDLDPTVDHYIFLSPVQGGDINACTSKTEQMVFVADGGAEGFMGWSIKGFITNDGASFEVVDWPQVEFPLLLLGDSNNDGHVEPVAGEQTRTNYEPRYGLQTVTNAVPQANWNANGVIAQHSYLLWQYVAYRLGFRLAPFWAAFGGRWQAGVMDAGWQALWTGGADPIWPGLFDNLSDPVTPGFLYRGNGGTAFNDAGDAITGGRFLSRVLATDLGSFANDQLRACLRQTGAPADGLNNVFDGSGIKDTLGLKAGSVGLVKQILDAAPTTKLYLHFSSHTDDGVNADYPDLNTTTKASMLSAVTGTDASYYRMQAGGADASFGLVLDVAASGVAGLPANVVDATLHYTAAQHLAIFAWEVAAAEPWLHTALGIVFVDSNLGNDSNAGTYAAPKRTIAGAGSGWTWLALKANSTFAEKLTIPGSGSSTVPKRVFTYGAGAQAIISGTAGTRDCIEAVSRTDIWLHNIHCDGGIVGVKLTTAAARIRLTNVTISNCTSHGISASVTSAAVNTIESCTIYDNAGDGINIASTALVDTYRNNVYGNAGDGMQIAGTTPTVNAYSDWIHDNDVNQVHVSCTGGTVNLRNGIYVAAQQPATVAPDYGSCVHVTGATVKVQHCLLDNASNVGYVYYCISAISAAARITWENCIFTGTSSPYVPYVRVEAVGASGAIVAARNNVHDDVNGTQPTDVKYVVWSQANGGNANLSTAYAFAAWQALLNRSGAAIENSSVFDSALLAGDPADLATDPLFGVPQAGSAAEGIAVNLTAQFTADYRNRTRPAVSADVGPFMIA